ncbi:MAG TPA: HDOD domain-containing protein [bacterium]|jgi:putative nucleotidyltransferase with HDIG domain
MASATTLDHLIAASCDIPSAPPVIGQLMQLMADPTVDAEQIGEVLSHDPTLVGELLRVANSSFYGRRGKVSNLAAAIMVLGFNALRNLVVALSTREIYGSFDGLPRALWEHANAVAVVAAAVAQRVGMVPVEDAFAAGLLHDLGMLLLHRMDEDRYAALLAGTPNLAALDEAERQVWGFDHGEVGAALAVRWGLPERMVMVVGAIHHLEKVAQGDAVVRRMAACVSLADGLCAEAGKAPLPAVGWDGGEALHVLGGKVTLDELRGIAAENLGAGLDVPI